LGVVTNYEAPAYVICVHPMKIYKIMTMKII